MEPINHNLKEIEDIKELISLILENADAEEVKEFEKPDEDFKMSPKYNELRRGHFKMPDGKTLKVIRDPKNHEYAVRSVPFPDKFCKTPLLGHIEVMNYIKLLKKHYAAN